jgi:hypothetical protein
VSRKEKSGGAYGVPQSVTGYEEIRNGASEQRSFELQ